MRFINKKGILERCGKNEKDVRWLDRAIKKGIVIHDVEEGYITTLDYIEELIKEREKKSEVVVSSNSKEVDELKERLGYVWGRYDMVKRSLMHVVDSYSGNDLGKKQSMLSKL